MLAEYLILEMYENASKLELIYRTTSGCVRERFNYALHLLQTLEEHVARQVLVVRVRQKWRAPDRREANHWHSHLAQVTPVRRARRHFRWVLPASCAHYHNSSSPNNPFALIINIQILYSDNIIQIQISISDLQMLCSNW